MSQIISKRYSQLGKLFCEVPKNFFLSSAKCSSVSAFRSLENHPGNHTKNDIGLFYSIPNSVSLEVLFKDCTYTPEYVEECKTFDETPILVRKPALEIINYLKNANYKMPINKYVLYGQFGSGKTHTMSHVIHYAHLSEWLIVHLPAVLSWLYSRTEATESTTKKDLIDLPTEGSKWLMHFKNQNEKLINKLDLRISKNYTWNISEQNKEGESLINLINHGITRSRYSCDVIDNLLEEIKLLSKSGKVKCLVAIDGFNYIFQSDTRIRNKDRKFVAPENISCMSTFKNIVKSDWHNGAAVLIIDIKQSISDPEDYFPMKHLGRIGFEFLDPFIPIEVLPLTKKEMTSYLAYYKSKKWLLNSDADKEVKFLCAGNPFMLRRICGPL